MKLLSRLIASILLLSILTSWQVAAAQTPVVHAVLFFSTDCSLCHKVIEEVLPTLKDKYQDQIDIVGIDITPDPGYALYESAVNTFGITEDRIGVPTMIIGDIVLVGADEIADQLPALIEKGISSGGIDWPDFPGLSNALAAQSDTPTNPPTISGSPEGMGGFIETFSHDPIANSLAVIVLILMVASVIFVAYYFIRASDHKFFHWPNWSIPMLTIIGLVAALYLSYVEVTGNKAICGPVGNCNSVQESPYARLFGVIPIGVMGAVGYIAILSAWLIQKYGPQSLRGISSLAIWGMTWFGILFSIYLTFLEPFVIGATCAWCLTSAIVMMFIFWASTGPAKEVWKFEDDDLEDEEENLEYQT